MSQATRLRDQKHHNSGGTVLANG